MLFIIQDSYSLNNVSLEILGDKKDDIDISKLYSSWDNLSPDLEDYCIYNLKDADLEGGFV